MSAVRVILFAAFCAIGIMGHALTTCPASAKETYDFQNCTAAQKCHQTRCACQGNTYYTSNSTCAHIKGTAYVSCTAAAACHAAFNTCMNNAASLDATCSVALADLKMSLLSVASGVSYNGSVAYTACARAACKAFNISVAATETCTVAVSTYCTAPVATTTVKPTTTATTVAVTTARPTNATTRPVTTAKPAIVAVVLRLDGDFTSILASPTALATFSATFKTTFATALKIAESKIANLKFAAGSLVVNADVDVTGTSLASGNNFDTAVSALSSDPSFSAGVNSAFTAAGGTGTVGVLSAGRDPRFTTVAPGQTLAPATTATTRTVTVAQTTRRVTAPVTKKSDSGAVGASAMIAAVAAVVVSMVL